MSHIETHAKQHYDMEKVVSVISYFTVIGWLVALVIHGKNRSSFTRFHLRQSLGLVVTSAILSFIPLIGWLLTVLLAFAWLVALVNAGLGRQFLVPVVGEFFQEHLDFIR